MEPRTNLRIGLVTGSEDERLHPYVASSLKGSEFFEGVSPNAFNVALHCCFRVISVPRQQCVDDGKMFLADFHGAFWYPPDGKQLCALSKVFDDGGEHGISARLRYEGMQIPAHCAEFFRRRISIVFHID